MILHEPTTVSGRLTRRKTRVCSDIPVCSYILVGRNTMSDEKAHAVIDTALEDAEKFDFGSKVRDDGGLGRHRKPGASCYPRLCSPAFSAPLTPAASFAAAPSPRPAASFWRCRPTMPGSPPEPEAMRSRRTENCGRRSGRRSPARAAIKARPTRRPCISSGRCCGHGP